MKDDHKDTHSRGRVIAKGDVVVIPNGTPHWFKEVKDQLLRREGQIS